MLIHKLKCMIKKGFVLTVVVTMLLPVFSRAQNNQRYKIGLIDLMLLKSNWA